MRRVSLLNLVQVSCLVALCWCALVAVASPGVARADLLSSPVVDPFDRANEGPPISTTWSAVVRSGDAGARVASSEVKGAAGRWSAVWRHQYGPDQDVSVSLPTRMGTSSATYLYARIQNEGVSSVTGYVLMVTQDAASGTDQWTIRRLDSGTSTTTIATNNSGTALANDSQVRFVTQGSTLTGYLLVSGAWVQQLQATDATYAPAASRTGLGGDGATGRLDDFRTGEVVPRATLLDSFDRANTGPPPSASWSSVVFTGDAGAKVASNAAKGASGRWSELWGGVFGPDQDVSLTVGTGMGTGKNVSLYSRVTNGNSSSVSGYALVINQTSDPDTDQWSINRIDSGTSTALATATASWLHSGLEVRFLVRGSDLYAYAFYNGLWWEQLHATDATYYPGASRVGLGGENATGTLDSFRGGVFMPEPTLRDSFDRSNEGPPPSSAWGSVVLSADGGVSVSSNKASGGSGSWSQLWDTRLGADQDVEATVSTAMGSTKYTRLFARVEHGNSAQASGYALVLNQDATGGTDEWTIRRITGGSFSTLATNSTGQIAAAGLRMRFVARGATLVGYALVGGVWVEQVQASDDAYAPERSRAGLGGEGTTGRIDDFRAVAIAARAALLDSFDRDNAGPPLGGGWSGVAFDWDSEPWTDNQQLVGQDARWSQVWGSQLGPDQDVSMTVGAPMGTGTWTYLLSRVTDERTLGMSGYALTVISDDTTDVDEWDIWRIDGGDVNEFLGGTLTGRELQPGTEIRFVTKGSDLTAYALVDGAWVKQAEATDSTYRPDRSRVGLGGNWSQGSLDDFRAGEILPRAPLLDNFNRANAGPPPSTAWGASVFAGDATASVNGHEAKGGDPTWSQVWGDALGPDQDVSMTLGSTLMGSGNDNHLFARITGAGTASVDGYELALYQWSVSGRDKWYLRRIDNGAVTTLATNEYGAEAASGMQVRLVVRGSDLVGYALIAGRWVEQVHAEDATYDPAESRIGLGGDFANGTLDDFRGGTLMPEPDLLDTFNRADESAPLAGNWGNVPLDGLTGMEIADEQADGETAAWGQLWEDTLGPDQDVEVTLATPLGSGNTTSLYTRLEHPNSASTSGYALELYQNTFEPAVDRWRIVRLDDGTPTTLADNDDAAPARAGLRMRFVARGSHLIGYALIDDAWVEQVNATDATYAPPHSRVGTGGAYSGGRLDNFRASATPEQAPLLDTFDRGNEGPPPSSDWTGPVLSGDSEMLVDAKQAYGEDAETWSQLWDTTLGPDQDVSVTLGDDMGSGNNAELYARIQGEGTANANGYVLSIFENAVRGKDEWRIHRLDDTALSTALDTNTNGTEARPGLKIRLVARGSTLTGYALIRGRWVQQVQATDTTYDPATSRIGLGGHYANGSYDDFRGAGNLGAFSATLPVDDPVAIALPEAGTSARLTFHADSGDNITIHALDSTFAAATMRLIGPDGETLASADLDDADVSLTPFAITTSGNYHLIISPAGTSTGSVTVERESEDTATLALTAPADAGFTRQYASLQAHADGSVHDIAFEFRTSPENAWSQVPATRLTSLAGGPVSLPLAPDGSGNTATVRWDMPATAFPDSGVSTENSIGANDGAIWIRATALSAGDDPMTSDAVSVLLTRTPPTPTTPSAPSIDDGVAFSGDAATIAVTWDAATSTLTPAEGDPIDVPIAGYAVDVIHPGDDLPEAAVTTTSTSISVPVPPDSDDPYVIVVRAIDAAGNVAEPRTTGEFHAHSLLLVAPVTDSSAVSDDAVDLQARSAPGSVCFQYRAAASTDDWLTIPAGDVTDASDTPIAAWPVTTTLTGSVYHWSGLANTPAIDSHSGNQVEVRAVEPTSGDCDTPTRTSNTSTITWIAAPDLTLVGGSGTWQNVASIELHAITDDEAVDHIERRTSADAGTTWSSAVSSATVTVTAEGETWVQFRTVRTGGHVDPWQPASPAARSVARIDRTNPTAPTASGGATTWTNLPLSIEAAGATDSLSGIDHYLHRTSDDEGTTWSEPALGSKALFKTTGVGWAQFAAVDDAGNQSPWGPDPATSDSKAWIDLIPPPVPEVIQPYGGWKNVTSVSAHPWQHYPEPDTGGSGFDHWEYRTSSDNRATWSTVSAGYSVVISDEGVTWVQFRAVDAAGNASDWWTTGDDEDWEKAVQIDRTAPTAPTVTGGSNDWQPVHSITITATHPADPTNYVYLESQTSTDGGTTWSHQRSGDDLQVIVTEPGETLVQFRTHDAAGNRSAWTPATPTAESTARLEDISNLPTAYGGTRSWQSSESLHISAACGLDEDFEPIACTADPETIEHRTSIDGGETWTAAQTGDYVDVTHEGLTYVQFREVTGPSTATPWLPNFADDYRTEDGTVMLDRTPPTPPTLTGGSDEWTNEPIELAVDGATDDLSGVACYDARRSNDDGATWTSIEDGDYLCEGPTITDDGDWIVQARSTDAAGNHSDWTPEDPSSDARARIDTTPPSLVEISSSTHPDPDEVYAVTSLSASWDALVDASGIAGYGTILDDAPDTAPEGVTQEGASVTASDLEGGTHYLHVRAFDNAGNGGDTATFTVQVASLDAPTIAGGTGEWQDTSSIDITASGSSGADHYESRISNGDGSAWSEPIAGNSRTITDEGETRVQFRAVAAGGTASPWAPSAPGDDSGTVRIDRTGPGAPVVHSASHPDPDSWYSALAIDARADAPEDLSGIAGYQVSLTTEPNDPSGDLVQPVLPVETAAGGGDWYLNVRAIDVAGNVGVSSHFRVRIDTTAPADPMISSTSHPESAQEYTDRTLDASWTTTDGSSGSAGYGVSIDGAQVDAVTQTESQIQIHNLGAGTHHLTVRARDHAGNWSGTADFTFHIAESLTARLAMPRDGARTARFLSLRAQVPPAWSDVHFEYRLGSNASAEWSNVPLDALNYSDHSAVTGDLQPDLLNGLTRTVQWDTSATPAIAHDDFIEIRVVATDDTDTGQFSDSSVAVLDTATPAISGLEIVSSADDQADFGALADDSLFARWAAPDPAMQIRGYAVDFVNDPSDALPAFVPTLPGDATGANLGTLAAVQGNLPQSLTGTNGVNAAVRAQNASGRISPPIYVSIPAPTAMITSPLDGTTVNHGAIQLSVVKQASRNPEAVTGCWQYQTGSTSWAALPLGGGGVRSLSQAAVTAWPANLGNLIWSSFRSAPGIAGHAGTSIQLRAVSSESCTTSDPVVISEVEVEYSPEASSAAGPGIGDGTGDANSPSRAAGRIMFSASACVNAGGVCEHALGTFTSESDGTMVDVLSPASDTLDDEPNDHCCYKPFAPQQGAISNDGTTTVVVDPPHGLAVQVGEAPLDVTYSDPPCLTFFKLAGAHAPVNPVDRVVRSISLSPLGTMLAYTSAPANRRCGSAGNATVTADGLGEDISGPVRRVAYVYNADQPSVGTTPSLENPYISWLTNSGDLYVRLARANSFTSSVLIAPNVRSFTWSHDGRALAIHWEPGAPYAMTLRKSDDGPLAMASASEQPISGIREIGPFAPDGNRMLVVDGLQRVGIKDLRFMRNSEALLRQYALQDVEPYHLGSSTVASQPNGSWKATEGPYPGHTATVQALPLGWAGIPNANDALAAYFRPKLLFDKAEHWMPLDPDVMLAEHEASGEGYNRICKIYRPLNPGRRPPGETQRAQSYSYSYDCAPYRGSATGLQTALTTARGELDPPDGYAVIDDDDKDGVFPVELQLHGEQQDGWDFHSPDLPDHCGVCENHDDPATSPIFYIRYNHGRFIYLQYWWFQRFNDANDAASQCNPLRWIISVIANPCDQHQGDWEGALVVISNGAQPKVIRAAYSQHSQWSRYGLADLKKAHAIDGTHIKIYSSLGSHASYPAHCEPRTLWPFLGCLNPTSHVTDADNDGQQPWVNNDDATCAVSRCVRTLASGVGGTINQYAGTWGLGGSLLGSSKFNDAPESPGGQSTWIQTWIEAGKQFPKGHL